MIPALLAVWNALGPRVSYALLAAVAAYGLGQWHGREAVSNRWEAAQAAQERAYAALVGRVGERQRAEIARLEARKQRVRTEIKEVTRYVETQPRDCVVHCGTIELFNAGLEDRVPVDRPCTAGAPSGIGADTVALHVYEELRRGCHANLEQLKALQAVVKEAYKR